MLKMYHIYKTYTNPKCEVLKDVNLHIKKGEFVFLSGASGAGKTTILRLIYMEEFPTSGQVIVANYNSQQIKKTEISQLRRKLGIVFQDFKLLWDRSVFHNVAFALQVIGISPKKIRKKVLSVLKDVGLSHRIHYNPRQLSGGEQQRVAIARALVNDPLLLLTDEPTGNLDPKISETILDLLKQINARGTSVLMATHNTELIRKLPYRILTLKDGKILE